MWVCQLSQVRLPAQFIQTALIDWRFTACQHKIGQFVPNYQGGLLAQSFEDSQRGTYKNIQLHAKQWTYTCNDKQHVCLTCLKINNACKKLHDPELVKKRKPTCNTFLNNESVIISNIFATEHSFKSSAKSWHVQSDLKASVTSLVYITNKKALNNCLALCHSPKYFYYRVRVADLSDLIAIDYVGSLWATMLVGCHSEGRRHQVYE